MSLKSLFSFLILASIIGCAKSSENTASQVAPEELQLTTNDISGPHLFLKSIVRVDRAGSKFKQLAAGQYLESDNVVKFRIERGSLSVVLDNATMPQVVARFPINEKTSYFEVQTASDVHQDWKRDDILSSFPKTTIVREQNAFHFEVEQLLSDGTQVVIKYSFRKYLPDDSYQARVYPKPLQQRFGYFKVSGPDGSELLARRNPTAPIVYHYSADFPHRLKPIVRNVFAKWNDAFVKAVGRPLLQLEENSGQGPGELTSNLIHFDSTEHSAHNILGYGPSYTDPKGQIVKADVVFYGAVLKRVLEKQRSWSVLMGTPLVPSRKEVLSTAFESPEDFAQRVETIHQHNHDAKSTHTTYMDQDTAIKLSELSAQEESDQLVEESVFGPLLAHELGHNLGLRHNFMGSVDLPNFAKASKSSTVMDYAFLYVLEPAGPGPYDVAALQFGYADAKRANAALNSSFLYCTDTHVESNKNGFCQQRDIGTSLNEIATHFRNRYFLSWTFNNVQTDTVYEHEDEQKYAESIYRLLKPLRVIYDYSLAIVRAADQEDWQSTWKLLGPIVEATPSTHPAQFIQVDVVAGFEVESKTGAYSLKSKTTTRVLDKKKIDTLRLDAIASRDTALNALRDIVFDGRRPAEDRVDSLDGTSTIRGILPDRLLALQLLSQPMLNSLGDQMESPFSNSNSLVASAFADLLSSSAFVTDAKKDRVVHRQSFPGKLRQLAERLRANSSSDINAESIVLFEVEKVSARWDKFPAAIAAHELVEKLEAFKNEILYSYDEKYLATVLDRVRKSGLLKTADGKPAEFDDATIIAEWWFGESPTFDKLMEPAKEEVKKAEGKLSETEKQIITHQIRRNELQRHLTDVNRAKKNSKEAGKALAEVNRVLMILQKEPVTYARFGDNITLRAPLRAALGSVPTATGRLIRDNINRLEDEIVAATVVLKEADAALAKELEKTAPIPKMLEVLEKESKSRADRLKQLEKALYQERLLLRKLQRLYAESHG